MSDLTLRDVAFKSVMQLCGQLAKLEVIPPFHNTKTGEVYPERYMATFISLEQYKPFEIALPDAQTFIRWKEKYFSHFVLLPIDMKFKKDGKPFFSIVSGVDDPFIIDEVMKAA